MVIKRHYSFRPDHERVALPGDLNLVAHYWRPLVDLTSNPDVSHKLKMTMLSNKRLGDEDSLIPWMSRLGVAGLRNQVLRDSGLDAYKAPLVVDLQDRLRTPGWDHLIDLMSQKDKLSQGQRAAVAHHLAQLSYCDIAVKWTGRITAADGEGAPLLASTVARAMARLPDKLDDALTIFQAISSANSIPKEVRVLASTQFVALSARRKNNVGMSEPIERNVRAMCGADPENLQGSFILNIALSRFYRAAALASLLRSGILAAQDDLGTSRLFHSQASKLVPDDVVAREILAENDRILIETDLKLGCREPAAYDSTDLRSLIDTLNRIDPNCIDVRLLCGDGYVAVGDTEAAAVSYARAGELATRDGAVGWFRAAQCLDVLGQTERAAVAMAHCLSLDPFADEAITYLRRTGWS
ncbi:MAG TPA: hypothetical protein VGE93_09180 [Bryobacteraceae bacterium]